MSIHKKYITAFHHPALRFVLIMGLVNLFSDFTYEGAGSLNGQFLGTLGASALVISMIAGVGEFFGYILRSLSGYIADKTQKYWLITFIGYAINLFSVPALAFVGVGQWKIAAGLMIAERIGRGIRKPTVEAMLSYTTSQFGKGWVYAINTALDETGAMLGPLAMSFVLFYQVNYRFCYSLLFISSILAIATLSIAKISYPAPADFEDFKNQTASAEQFGQSYWLYMLAGVCFAAGLMSFELVTFHLAKTKQIAEAAIPAYLAFSTACGIVASLFLGRYYDRFGTPVLLIAVVLSALFAPLLFLGNFVFIIISMIFWGIGYATQDTLLKAVVAGMLPKDRRSFAFGLFYTGYGVGWFIGSILAGFLYERSLLLLSFYCPAIQILSMILFAFAANRIVLSKNTSK